MRNEAKSRGSFFSPLFTSCTFLRSCLESAQCFRGTENPIVNLQISCPPPLELVNRATGLQLDDGAGGLFPGVTECDSEGEAMNSGQALPMGLGAVDPDPLPELPQWYAIRTRSRHEKMVAEQLERQGIESFLPLVKRTHKWSDRKKEVELPLFSGYSFARLAFCSRDRVRVLQTHGVAGFVGVRGAGIPVPEGQIESLRTLLANQIPMQDRPFLQVGQRVRIRGGALDGIEGILAAQDNRNLIISVEPIHRSLSVCIEGYRIEPI
jgi:transcription antitermination factor NusG